MFQKTEQSARRRSNRRMATGPAIDQTWYRTITKQPTTVP